MQNLKFQNEFEVSNTYNFYFDTKNIFIINTICYFIRITYNYNNTHFFSVDTTKEKA